jgi:hypothetical protein
MRKIFWYKTILRTQSPLCWWEARCWPAFAGGTLWIKDKNGSFCVLNPPMLNQFGRTSSGRSHSHRIMSVVGENFIYILKTFMVQVYMGFTILHIPTIKHL